MRIGLIDIDGKIPNLALKKVEKFYLDQNCEIIWNNLTLKQLDKVYISSIFTKSLPKLKQFEGLENYFIGGTGYNIKSQLPEEIYKIKPKINLDFTTRGCIRKCSFCFVPEKEGKIKVERDLYDIWDGKSKEVILLDNNILATQDHFKLICSQAQKEHIKLDFNQGLDIRLVNDENAFIMSKTKLKEKRFALDNISDIPKFDEKLRILRKYFPTYYFFVYVLVGYNSTWNEDMERLNFLKMNNCRAYVMRHEKVENDSNYATLASWANQQSFFYSLTFDRYNYLRHNRNELLCNKKVNQIKLF